ncbi:hypothetical protein [Paenibacillus sp. MMS18-CY102]|uniref:hypothetical protein n=1 Tax=Paenibacillus sp. MMS18-CY102 TaxID=2682849 RepID=UPI001365A246|nr:hypothetical protein [Paenibacillus sp. MMS18-CY102]MWC26750.1 hypothetical protein [Paenibacillus sp. MMS18-CY102]
MFELNDIIPYLFSISVLCSLAYVYFCWTAHSPIEYYNSEPYVWLSEAPLAGTVREWADIRHGLVRKVKRKEAPDEDATDCNSSLAEELGSTIRGGFKWGKYKEATAGSLSRVVTDSYYCSSH